MTPYIVKICFNNTESLGRQCAICGSLFVILIIIDIHGHRFKVFTLVSEIHDNVDLVLGMKNVFELEGLIDMWDS